MTLRELSYEYSIHAEDLNTRIRTLRKAAKETKDPVLRNTLEQRMNALKPLLQEARELARLTRHYYDRRYHRNEKYTL